MVTLDSGEMLGLGLTFAITGLFFLSIGEQNTTASILLSFTVAVLSGAVEATVVGLAQWWAMHPWFPSIQLLPRRRRGNRQRGDLPDRNPQGSCPFGIYSRVIFIRAAPPL